MRSRASPSGSSSTWPPSCRRWPARSGRRTGCSLSEAKPAFRSALVDYAGEDASRRATTRRWTSRSPPPTPRRTTGPTTPTPRTSRVTALRGGPGEQADAGGAGRRVALRARPRRGGDRRDHLVHQHLQPVGDDRCRAAGQERRREGPAAQALGEDHAGARVEGRLRLLRAGRPHAVPRQARLQPRRLRLHHLHRQLGPADPRGLRGRAARATCRSCRCCRATATSRAGSTPTSR